MDGETLDGRILCVLAAVLLFSTEKRKSVVPLAAEKLLRVIIDSLQLAENFKYYVTSIERPYR